MAGRGGKTSSFTKEQLQAMGVSGKEIPATQLPPPLFPPLVNKPGPPDDNMERQYKIMWKDDFVNYLKDSPYFLTAKPSKMNSPDSVELQKVKEKPNFCWNLMPPELKPNFKRTAPAKPGVSKPSLITKRIKPGATMEERLNKLEENETVGGTRIKTDPQDEEEQMEDETLQEDDEMDDENDYGNSYFDNGESFNDEDDNLDDGPVY